MIVAARSWHLAICAVGLTLSATGCIYHGSPADPADGPGTPVGITVLRIPVEKFVIPAPPPGGFSGTYHRMLLDRQRLAAKQAQREAEGKASETKPKENAGSAGKGSTPSA